MRIRGVGVRQWRRVVGGLPIGVAMLVVGCGGPPTVPDGSVQVLRPAHQVRQDPVRGLGGTGYRVLRRAGQIPSDWVPMEWSAVNVKRASDRVLITWVFGSCGSKDFTVFMDETPSRVIVDVWNDPSFSGACDDMGHTGTATVTLDAPLGQRPLLKHRVEESPTSP